MGAGVVANFSDLPAGAKVLNAPAEEYGDLPSGAKVLPPDETAHVSVAHRMGTPSAGYQYSTGYQGANDQPRDSGGFIDRMTTQAGRAIGDPSNFIPSWHVLLGPPGMAYEGAKGAWDQYQHRNDPQEDPAKTLGNLAPAALTAAVTHAGEMAPDVNISRSEVTSAGTAHPIEGFGRFARALPRPDMISLLRDPLKSAYRAVAGVPEAIRAGLGEDVRIQPRPRVEPAWRTAPAEGAEVPSILDREPTSAGPGRSVYPGRPRIPIIPAQAEAAAAPAEVAAPSVEGVASPRTDALLTRLRQFAAKIPAEGTEEAPPVAVPSRPMRIGGRIASPDTDLTSALERSLKKAGKRPKVQ